MENDVKNICLFWTFVQNETRVSKIRSKKGLVLCEILREKVLTKGEEGDILSKSLREGHVRVKDEEIPA